MGRKVGGSGGCGGFGSVWAAVEGSWSSLFDVMLANWVREGVVVVVVVGAVGGESGCGGCRCGCGGQWGLGWSVR